MSASVLREDCSMPTNVLYAMCMVDTLLFTNAISWLVAEPPFDADPQSTIVLSFFIAAHALFPQNTLDTSLSILFETAELSPPAKLLPHPLLSPSR